MSIESLTVESDVIHELRQALLQKQRVIDRLEEEKLALELRVRGLSFVLHDASVTAEALHRKLCRE